MSTTKPDFRPSTLRRHVLHMAHSGNSVHVGCAFSLIEIISVLYGDVMRYDATKADADERDHLVLSKGHGAMAIYAAYRELGWLQQSDLDNYFADGSLLHGLCEAKIPGMEVCSGTLGHGLPIAVGMAYGLKRNGSDRTVYCIVGDGEMNEGPMWEALLFANQHKLDNLVVIVDANGLQAMGRTTAVIDMEPFAAKFEAFGFDTIDCNGHDMALLKTALRPTPGKPHAVVARTTKGYGVSFMEDKLEWHYLRLNPELLKDALSELEAPELLS
ncbi:transketolase [Hydrocarboniphaga sp.]|uniref:transketolase n=1 Tax=Hydrocarboniphaga sp. TaxID=2033016 RepID=UPI003D0A9FD0